MGAPAGKWPERGSDCESCERAVAEAEAEERKHSADGCALVDGYWLGCS